MTSAAVICPECVSSSHFLRGTHRDAGRCLIDHELRRLRGLGMGYATIAKEIGRGRKFVEHRIKSLPDIERRAEMIAAAKRVTCADCDDAPNTSQRSEHRNEGRCHVDRAIHELREEGVRVVDIARIIGMSFSAVRYRIRTLDRPAPAAIRSLKFYEPTPEPVAPRNVERAERLAAEYAKRLEADGSYSREAAESRARAAYGLARVSAAHYEPTFSREIRIAHVVASAMSRGGE